MDLALLLARLALAAVFVVAGAAKLADLPGSRKAATGFGVPERLAPAVGILLPITELAIGVALVPTVSARWGALAALALLVTFIAAIGLNLAKGRTPDCHCFGQLHSAPAGWSTIARNGGLAAIAALILVAGWGDPGASAFAWLTGLSGIDTVLLVGGLLVLGLLALLGWVVVNLMSQNGRLLTRLDALEAAIATGEALPSSAPAADRGLPVGTPAPAFTLPDLERTSKSLDAVRQPGVPLLLLFTDPGCGPCNQVLRQLNRWRESAGDRLDFAVISRGAHEANLAKAREHGLDRVLLQTAREVAGAYGIRGTPAAVIVRPDGTIGTPLAGGVDAIQVLVTSTLESNAAPAPSAPSRHAPELRPTPTVSPVVPSLVPLAIGDAVPSLLLATLDGHHVDLADESPTDRVLLFWNPGCGFCQRLVSDLKARESQRSPGRPDLPDLPDLVIVSAGTAEATRAHGFASLVLLDNGQGTGRRFGAHGTPAAVRIDAQGYVASPVASGMTGVLGLLEATAIASERVGGRPPLSP